MTKRIKIADFEVGQDLPFMLMAGPCQLESRDHTFMMVEKLKEITTKLKIPFIFKASFDKANRTSLNAKRGLGIEEGLKLFADVKKEFNVPVVTDIHTEEQCAIAAEVVDVLQIPAFLSRQTDLLVAAAKTGKVINVKKGQFMAPWDMQHSIKKITDSGNDNVMACERGASFGYNTLVSDFRGLPIMAKQTGKPVIFDATHSVQQPGGQGGTSGGQREFVPVLARAAVSVGVAGLFVETHQEPDTAPSDGPNMMRLDQMEAFLTTLKEFDAIAKANPVEI